MLGLVRQLRLGHGRSRAVTDDDIFAAQEQLVLGRQTHLDQLADKLGEDRVRRVVEPLLSGAAADDSSARDIEYVRDLGLIARDDPPRIANPIYAEAVSRELTGRSPRGGRGGPGEAGVERLRRDTGDAGVRSGPGECRPSAGLEAL